MNSLNQLSLLSQGKSVPSSITHRIDLLYYFGDYLDTQAGLTKQPIQPTWSSLLSIIHYTSILIYFHYNLIGGSIVAFLEVEAQLSNWLERVRLFCCYDKYNNICILINLLFTSYNYHNGLNSLNITTTYGLTLPTGTPLMSFSLSFLFCFYCLIRVVVDRMAYDG